MWLLVLISKAAGCCSVFGMVVVALRGYEERADMWALKWENVWFRYVAFTFLSCKQFDLFFADKLFYLMFVGYCIKFFSVIYVYY